MTAVMTQDPEQSEAIEAGRHFLAVFFLCFMWGAFGVDRFYLGKVGTGLLKLLTFGGFGIWVLIDMVLILSGAMRDKQDRPMREYARYKMFAVKTIVIFSIVSLVVFILASVGFAYAIYELSTYLQNYLQSSGLQVPTDLQIPNVGL